MEEELIPDELKALTEVQLSEPTVGESLEASTIWWVGAGFLAIVALMLLFILLRRWWQNKQEIREQAYIERYQSYLAEFTAISVTELFEEMNLKSQKTYFLTKKDLQRSRRRHLLANEIYQLHLNLEGSQAQAIKTLFLGLSLMEDTSKNLGSRYTDVVINALREVRAYQLTNLMPKVKTLLFSKNEEVRHNALLVYVGLLPHELDIIEQFEEPLTDWQKHKILFGLQQGNKIKEDYLSALMKRQSIHAPFYGELKAILFPSPAHYEIGIKNLTFA